MDRQTEFPLIDSTPERGRVKTPLAPAAVQPLPLEFLTTGKLPVVNTIDQFKEDYE